jgi:hypothetical protein
MRYLGVDEVLALQRDPAPSLRAARTFPPEEPALAGPAGPDEVPTGLLLEFMVTAGGALVAHCLGDGRLPLLLQAEDCEFRRRCRRGERLVASARLEAAPAGRDAPVARASVEVCLGGSRVAGGRFLYLAVHGPALPCLGAAPPARAGGDGP